MPLFCLHEPLREQNGSTAARRRSYKLQASCSLQLWLKWRPMALLQVILFLMFCAVAVGWIARRARIPYPIALVIGGALLGFMPELPQLPFDPQFILVLVLPPVLYQAALLTSWRDFKAHIRPISLLAIGLVIATTLVV